MDNESVIYYEIDDVTPLLSSLDSLTKYLSANEYRIVIAPTGPKLFTLVSLLINLSNDQVTTYRLSDGNKAAPINKKPNENKEPIIVQLRLKSSDN